MSPIRRLWDPEVATTCWVQERPSPLLAIDADLVRVARLVHLGGHEIEIAVLVHIGGLEGVHVRDGPVHHVLDPRPAARSRGAVPRQATARRLGRRQDDVSPPVPIDVHDKDTHVERPIGRNRVLSPRRPGAIRVLEPKAVVGDVEVAVVVDIAESGSFASAGAGDDARPGGR